MNKRIAAVVFIFICTSVAWMILGGTIFTRTDSTGALSESRVESTWGSAQVQRPPEARWYEQKVNEEPVFEGNRTVMRRSTTTQTINLDLEQSRVKVNFDLDHRKKGLLWYSTYGVDFAGEYLFRNESDEAHTTIFTFPLPAQNAVYDGLALKVNGAPLKFATNSNNVTGDFTVPPHEAARLSVAYHSQGMDTWRYSFGENVSSVRDFQLEMGTDFKKIDFPDSTLSLTRKQETSNGWNLTWDYKNLISGFQIGMKMPDKLQPGPLAGKISFFAPVSLFFFFFVMFILCTIRGIELHPMNYFFIAAAFFAFHLLLAYLVDHISIHLAFVICSAVSIFLVVSYLRLVVGSKFAMREAALAQFVYLVLFSYAFFFEGFTGLSITIGAIVTLFVAMQTTGRMNWGERFQKRPAFLSEPLRD
jgi:Inner membrane protein CreD